MSIVKLSKEMEELIIQVSLNNKISKNEVLKKALALLKISEEQSIKGRSLGIIKENEDGSLSVIGKII